MHILESEDSRQENSCQQVQWRAEGFRNLMLSNDVTLVYHLVQVENVEMCLGQIGLGLS